MHTSNCLINKILLLDSTLKRIVSKMKVESVAKGMGNTTEL